MSPEAVIKGSNTSVRSIPNYSFPSFKQVKEEGNKGLPRFVKGRPSIAIDLGTPNLGTGWDITSLSLFYEKIKYVSSFEGVVSAAGPIEFYVIFYVYLGGAEVFREASNRIKSPEQGEAAEESSLVGLQNLPQSLHVPGGQQLAIEFAVYERPEGSAPNFVEGQFTGGKLTMAYNIVDYHGKPRKQISRGGVIIP